jgi:hypothetical protein
LFISRLKCDSAGPWNKKRLAAILKWETLRRRIDDLPRAGVRLRRFVLLPVQQAEMPGNFRQVLSPHHERPQPVISGDWESRLVELA